jgi:DNA repair photolyase
MINEIKVKSILNKHKKRDDWFLDDYTVNQYSGCSFNCIYCYVRGSKYEANLAKKLCAKINAPELLDKELKRRAEKGEYGIIALSSSTEPYMPIEEKFNLTRRILEIILKYRFPVEIATKSKLVLRDLDLLWQIDKSAILPEDLKSMLNRGVIISFSISTLDIKLAKILESGAPSPLERLETLKKCKEKGFLVGLNYIPVLPFLSDSEDQIDEMIKTAKEYCADFVFVGGLTLFGKEPYDSKILYYQFLGNYYPDLLSKYKNLYRIFFAPTKEYQMILNKRAEKNCEKYGIKIGFCSKIN